MRRLKLCKHYLKKGLKRSERSRIWYATRAAENILLAGLEPGFDRLDMTLRNRTNPNGFHLTVTRTGRNKADVKVERMINLGWAQQHGYADAYHTHTGFPRGKKQRARLGL